MPPYGIVTPTASPRLWGIHPPSCYLDNSVFLCIWIKREVVDHFGYYLDKMGGGYVQILKSEI